MESAAQTAIGDHRAEGRRPSVAAVGVDGPEEMNRLGAPEASGAVGLGCDPWHLAYLKRFFGSSAEV